MAFEHDPNVHGGFENGFEHDLNVSPTELWPFISYNDSSKWDDTIHKWVFFRTWNRYFGLFRAITVF